MKVLWLCNIMLPIVAEYLHMEASNKEGWLSGLMSVVLERQAENDIELAVAFPAAEKLRLEIPVKTSKERGILKCYGFVNKNANQPEIYDASLEGELREIVQDFAPDMVHCFGTEYPHTLAMCKVFPDKERILVGIQGLCFACAEAYFADLPESAIKSVTFRDILRKDTLKKQQEKFKKRGEIEVQALKLAGNITGRTAWDKAQVQKWNPDVKYYHMNETLRANFYEGKWEAEDCEPHSIFLSQGDYPLKGLHYMLQALPHIRAKYPDVKVYVAGADLTKTDSLKARLKLSAYGKYLRKLIRANHLQDNIHFLGRLTGEEMKARYLKSAAFVCTSSLENSPNSLGEAMLLGVPCISAAVGGVPSLFEDGKDGICYDGFKAAGPEQIVNNLAEAVLQMWEEPGKMLMYSQNAQAHARRTHDGETNYRRMVEIYTEIVRGGREG